MLDEKCRGKAVVEIAAGTQPGDVVVRRGEGIPRITQGSRGDQVIQFEVEIPKKLGKRER